MTEDNETLTHKRPAFADDGMGSKVETLTTLGTVSGRVRFYQERGSRQELETAPGRQRKTERLVVFDAPFPNAKEGDLLVRGSGETLTVRFVRGYRFSYQVDTEIVK